MKRHSFAIVLRLLLAHVGLGSCNDSSLRKDILGEWVGDPSTLKALERITNGRAKFHSYNFIFNDEKQGVLNLEYTMTSKMDGMVIDLRLAFAEPLTYSILGGRLSFTLDQAAARVELLEYLINGKACLDLLREESKDKDEQAIQEAYEKIKKEMEESVKEGMRESFGASAFEDLGNDIKVKDGVLSMRATDGVPLSFHRKKS